MAIEYRVIGPPGTGKTRYVMDKVADAVRRAGPEGVTVASFTRAAAVEIASRAREYGGGIPQHHIGTLHSLALRQMDGQKLIYGMKDALASWNAYGGFPLSSLEGDTSGDELDADAPAMETLGDKCLAAMERLRARMVPREAWPAHVRTFAERWDSWKLENGAADFTDLLEWANDYIETAPGDPRYLFIDEAQDLSALEISLARKWAGSADVFVVVGDGDQALYRWRGADPEVFSSGTADRVLEDSYRVPRAVHAVATEWISRTPGREPVTYRPRDCEGEVVRKPAWNWKRPEPLVYDICRYVEARRDDPEFIDHGGVMVLASCEYMLRPLIAVLREHGVPFHNPYRRKAGMWNPLASKHGTKDRLLSFLRFDGDVWGEQARNWTMADLHDWLDLCEAKGLVKTGVKAQVARLVSMPDAMEPLEAGTLDRLFEDEALSSLMSHPFQPKTLDWFASRVLPSKRKALEFPLAVARNFGAAELRHRPLVTVGTVHSVKGGEAARVYLMPDLSPQALQGWSAGAAAERADVRRLFYVGMTRARESLVLLGAARAAMGVQWEA